MSIGQDVMEVEGLNIRYFYAGTGSETILLLHGAGVDSAMLSWPEVMALLSKDYRVIAPDLPGYGGSDRFNGDYSLSFYTQIVKGVIEKLQCGPVVLAGLSLGGGISLNLAIRHPELVRLLIPVDAWGLFRKLPFHRMTYWYSRLKLNDQMNGWSGNYRSFVRWTLGQHLIGDKSKITDDLVDEVRRVMLEPLSGRPFASFQRSEITSAGLKTDLFGQLGEIAMPTLLIHGSKDKAVPVKDAIAASKKIRDCRLYLMEGCKHWPHKERPEEFSEAVDVFIREHSSS